MFLVFFLFLFFVAPSIVQAECYYIGTPGFNTCQGNMSPLMCFTNPGLTLYACCDLLAESCPPEPTPIGPSPTPRPPTPIPPTPIATTPTPIPPTPPPPSSICTSPNGCFYCDWSIGDGCFWNPAFDSRQCTGGYTPNDSGCAALTGLGENACRRAAVPCSTDTRPYYCDVNSGCTVCPATGCPALVDTFPNRALCTNSCHAPPPMPSSMTFMCDASNTHILTAIGCIPYRLNPFIDTVLRWGVGIAGGIVMIVIGIAAFIITTAGGDAKKVKAGQEMITAAIGGIILLVFSVLILNFIGVNILNIGSLGFLINP